MLMLDNQLAGMPVASVQASRAIGRTSGYLIDPRKLHIVALSVDERTSPEPKVLHTSDIRELGGGGVIIDHDNQLMDTDGLVRLQSIIDIDFKLIGKPVETEDGRRLGKVGAFAFDSLTWLIMRLYVGQSVVKSVGSSELIVHRRQIVKVSDQLITVASASVKSKAKFSLKRLLWGGKPALNPDAISLKE